MHLTYFQKMFPVMVDPTNYFERSGLKWLSVVLRVYSTPGICVLFYCLIIREWQGYKQAMHLVGMLLIASYSCDFASSIFAFPLFLFLRAGWFIVFSLSPISCFLNKQKHRAITAVTDITVLPYQQYVYFLIHQFTFHRL